MYYIEKDMNNCICIDIFVVVVVSVTPSEEPGYESQTSPSKSRGGAVQRVKYGRGDGSISHDLRQTSQYVDRQDTST